MLFRSLYANENQKKAGVAILISDKTRNEKGEVTMDTIEIQSILRDYCKQLYANKMDNVEEMDKFLEKHNLPRLNQEKNRKYKQTDHKHRN